MDSPLLILTSTNPEQSDNSQTWEKVQFLTQIGRIDESLKLAYQIYQQDPSYQQSYSQHYVEAMKLGAELGEETGEHQQAEKYWYQLTQYQKQNVEAWYGLSVAQFNLEKYTEALASAQQVSTLDSQYKNIQNLLDYIQSKLGEG